MISPALQQAVAWHREQTTRVRAYRPQRPDIPGKPGDCDNCVPPPPPLTQIQPQMPTAELFTSGQIPIITPHATLATVLLASTGIALFVRLLA